MLPHDPGCRRIHRRKRTDGTGQLLVLVSTSKRTTENLFFFIDERHFMGFTVTLPHCFSTPKTEQQSSNPRGISSTQSQSPSAVFPTYQFRLNAGIYIFTYHGDAVSPWHWHKAPVQPGPQLYDSQKHLREHASLDEKPMQSNICTRTEQPTQKRL